MSDHLEPCPFCEQALRDAAERIKLAINKKRQKHQADMEGRWHTTEYEDGLTDALSLACAAILEPIEKEKQG